MCMICLHRISLVPVIESITQRDEKFRDAVSWPVVVTVKAAGQVSETKHCQWHAYKLVQTCASNKSPKAPNIKRGLKTVTV